MGLNQHDQVIRRRLAQKLEFLAKDLVALTPPTDEELQTYFDTNRDRYQEPVRYIPVAPGFFVFGVCHSRPRVKHRDQS